MTLIIDRIENLPNYNGQYMRGTWFVGTRRGTVINGGFGRERDAEIARHILENMGVDWSLPYAQRPETPLQDERMRQICEALQW